MSDSVVLYRKNDTLIEWQWLSRSTDAEYLASGVVTFTLYSGYALDPETGIREPSAGDVNVIIYGPAAMNYVTGSLGKYQGKLPSTVNLDLSLDYTLEINCTALNHVARRSIGVTVIDRTT